MKLTYFQLEQQLAKKLFPVYLISGEEPLLKQDVFQWIRKAAQLAGFNERITFSAENNHWDELYNLLYAQSLLAEKRIIEFDLQGNLPPKAAIATLLQYAENPAENTLLLFNFAKLEPSTAKSKWYTALEKISVAVNLWPIDRVNLPAWLIQRSKKYKLTFPLPAAMALADLVEGNLVAASQALEKIYLLQPEEITAEFMQTFMQDEGRFSIFDFSQQIMSGDAGSSLRMLQSLQEEGIEPAIILWGITRELRLLAQMSQQLKSGTTYEKLWQQHKIFARRQTSARRFLNQFSHAQCCELLQHASEIDQIIKGVVSGQVWNSLQLFCLRLI